MTQGTTFSDTKGQLVAIGEKRSKPGRNRIDESFQEKLREPLAKSHRLGVKEKSFPCRNAVVVALRPSQQCHNITPILDAKFSKSNSYRWKKMKDRKFS